MNEENLTYAGLTQENSFGHQVVVVAGSAVPAGFRI